MYCCLGIVVGLLLYITYRRNESAIDCELVGSWPQTHLVISNMPPSSVMSPSQGEVVRRIVLLGLVLGLVKFITGHLFTLFSHLIIMNKVIS